MADGIRTTYSAVQWIANMELASTRRRTVILSHTLWLSKIYNVKALLRVAPGPM